MCGWAVFVAVTPEENILHMQPKAPHEQGDSSISWGWARTQGFSDHIVFIYILFTGILINLHCHVGKGASIPKYSLRQYLFVFSNARFFVSTCLMYYNS